MSADTATPEAKRTAMTRYPSPRHDRFLETRTTKAPVAEPSAAAPSRRARHDRFPEMPIMNTPAIKPPQFRARTLIPIALAIGATSAHAEPNILELYLANGGKPPVGIDRTAPETADNGAGAPAQSAPTATNPLATGRAMSDEKIEDFNNAVDNAFPMTPEMIRRYREIFDESERAARERPEPKARTSATLISLAPGEPAPRLRVSPSIASVISFHDVTGSAWPVAQYVLGNDEDFEALHLGENSNNIVLTPGTRIGFTNLVVVLEGHDRPVTIRINIAEDIADYRFDIQMMRPGPRAVANNAAGKPRVIAEAGDDRLLAAVGGINMPGNAKAVEVAGVDARGWLIDGDLYLRSRHALLSPAWTGSMAGPGGLRAYRIAPASAALFSVGGRIVRADIQLP